MLIASASEAYGKQEGAPLKEDDDVTYGSSGKARWSYAASKLMDTPEAYGTVINILTPVSPIQFS